MTYVRADLPMRPPRTDIALLDAVAHHESGHAAAAFELGCRVRMVSAMPTFLDGVDRLGHCTVRFPAGFAQRIIIFLAGPAAEFGFTGQWRPQDWEHDFFEAERYARMIAGPERWEDVFEDLWRQTEEIVGSAEVWSGICSLAQGLQLHRMLTGPQAEKLYRAGELACR